MSELARRPVSVIVAVGGSNRRWRPRRPPRPSPSSSMSERIRSGSVWFPASLSRPGGNVTGNNFFSGELVAKHLEILRELVPVAARVAVLVNPAHLTAEPAVREAQATGRAAGTANPSAQCRQRQGNRCGFRDACARAARRAARRFRPSLCHATRAIGAVGGLPQDPGDLSAASICGDRRVGHLRHELDRRLSSSRHLYRAYPQGREARGVAGRAVDEVRIGHQCPDRPDAWPCRAPRCSPAPTR